MTAHSPSCSPRHVKLSGELDLASAPRLHALLGALDGHHVVLDCSQLTFVDSSGLHALVEARTKRSAGVSIVHPSRCLERLAELTCTTSLLLDAPADSGELPGAQREP